MAGFRLRRGEKRGGVRAWDFRRPFGDDWLFEPGEAAVEPVARAAPVKELVTPGRFERFGCQNYLGSDVTKARDVPDDKKPDAILRRLLESTQEGGMRERRAKHLH